MPYNKPLPPLPPAFKPYSGPPGATKKHLDAIWHGLDKYNMPNDMKRLIIQKYMQGKRWGWRTPGKMHGPKKRWWSSLAY